MPEDKIPTFAEIRGWAKRPGVKIFALVRVTYDDVINVRVTKADFLQQISPWDGSAEAATCQILDDGNIGIG